NWQGPMSAGRQTSPNESGASPVDDLEVQGWIRRRRARDERCLWTLMAATHVVAMLLLSNYVRQAESADAPTLLLLLVGHGAGLMLSGGALRVRRRPWFAQLLAAQVATFALLYLASVVFA